MTVFVQLMYMAIVLYGPSLALSQVTGLHVWTSVLSIGLVCTFYTTIGGIKAVVWTDLFQTAMMLGAMLVIVVKGAHDVGGIAYVWRRSQQGQRIQFFNLDLDPTVRHTFWNMVFGSFVNWLGIYGVNQAMVQRYLTVSTLRGAKITVWMNLPGLAMIVSTSCVAGLVIYARYFDCDPLLTRQVTAPDQLFPLFVMDTLGSWPGLPGLFVSGIFSGALSTVSSGVNSLAAVTLEDVVKAYFCPDIAERLATRWTKALALLYGVVTIVLVAVAQQLGNVLQAAISVFGMLGGPQLGMFVLGMFFPFANTTGAACGLLAGLGISFWIGVGSFIHKPYIPRAPVSIEGCLDLYFNATAAVNHTAILTPGDAVRQNVHIFGLYRLSYQWFSVVSFAVTMVVGLAVSAATGGNRSKSVKEELLSPWVSKSTFCFPTKPDPTSQMSKKKRLVNGSRSVEGLDNPALSVAEEAKSTDEDTKVTVL